MNINGILKKCREEAEKRYENKMRGSIGKHRNRKERWKRNSFVEGAKYAVKELIEMNKSLL